jgi:hypothetical protein
MYATREILERVVRITRKDGKTGSGTIIERAGSVYLMTAAHVLPKDVKEPLVIETPHKQENRAFLRVPGMNPKADVAALRLTGDWGLPQLPITLTGAGVIFSQDAFFLGFPFGHSFRQNPSAPNLPFIKKGTLSAIDYGDVTIYYLDGINNIGFSGGPVFVPSKGAGQSAQVFGVVSGYHEESLALSFGGKPSDYATVAGNSGIMLAYDVKHVLEAIDAHGAR